MPRAIRRMLMTTDTVGGVWTYSIELARALQARGVETTLAAIGRTSLAQRDQARGLDVREGDFKLEWMEDPWDDVRASGDWLLGICREVRPDAIHLNGYAHATLPWPSPPLVVGHSCVLGWFAHVRGEAAPLSFDRYREAVRRGIQAAGLVVAPTRAMLADLRRFYGAPRAARTIRNARDPRLTRRRCSLHARS